MSFTEEVKKKREFSKLPDSVVRRASRIRNGDLKLTRELLRKYFGVFLTNKVIKGKGSFGEILRHHISSKERDYSKIYSEIFNGKGGEIKTVIDLGCGVNGFSYEYLKKELGKFSYLGIEAAGQIVKNTNEYFRIESFDARVVHGDLFDVEKVALLIKGCEGPKVIFMFQVIDALESFEKDFSKKLILEIMEGCEFLVISLSLNSLSGRKNFSVDRKWLIEFLEEEFKIEKDFVMSGERFIIVGKKL